MGGVEEKFLGKFAEKLSKLNFSSPSKFYLRKVD